MCSVRTRPRELQTACGPRCIHGQRRSKTLAHAQSHIQRGEHGCCCWVTDHFVAALNTCAPLHTPPAAAMAPKAMPSRAELRQLKGPPSPFASGSWLAAGTRTLSKKIMPVVEALSENLPSILGVLMPSISCTQWGHVAMRVSGAWRDCTHAV